MAKPKKASGATEVERLRKSLAREKAKRVALEHSLGEAREQATATAEILALVRRSPTDLRPVCEAVARRARRLLGGHSAVVARRVEDRLHLVAHTATTKAGDAALTKVFPAKITGEGAMGKAVLAGKPVCVVDFDSDARYSESFRSGVRKRGYRSLLVVPMMLEGAAIGAISVSRRKPGPFTDQQIDVLKSFADQAVIAIENVRLFNETKEALDRQAATSEVLGVISRSTTQLQPVLDAIVTIAARLCRAEKAQIFLWRDNAFRWASGRDVDPEYVKIERETPILRDRGTLVGRTAVEGRTVTIDDAWTDSEYAKKADARIGKVRSMIGVPLKRENEVIGVIALARNEARPFSRAEAEIVTTFADQAVIAIENVRLFNETKEALERQTATAEILGVIAASPSDVQPVFDIVAHKAVDLCSGTFGVVTRYDGERIHIASISGSASFTAADSIRAAFPAKPSRRGAASRSILTRDIVHMPDVQADPEYTPGGVASTSGIQSILAVPLMRGEVPLGSVSVAREQRAPFSGHQIALLRTFADQAVIAIENVRLFNETKEALERQTATAEILKVIGSSPTDSQPVFEAIVQAGLRLFPGATIGVTRPEGNRLQLVAIASRDPASAAATKARFPIPLTRDYLNSTAVLDARLIDMPDAELDREGPFAPGVLNFLATGNRAMTVMPMLRGAEAIGTISVTRAEPGPLTDKQLALLRIFADQAVIAIENVRLFNETKEALERQTATAEILRVMADSPTDVQPVFDVIVESAVKLCGARFGRVYQYDGSIIHMAASHGLSVAGLGEVQRVFPRPVADDTIVGRVVLGRQPFLLKDIERDSTVPALSRHMMAAMGTRSQVTIPMLRSGEPIGAITMGWDAPDGFDDRQVRLLKTFADQAVIAIENVRLFNETKEALDQQQVSAEILRIVSQSVADSQPVFDAILAAVRRLFPGFDATVWRVERDQLLAVARGGTTIPSTVGHSVPITRDFAHGIAVLDRKAIRLDDIASSPDLSEASRQDLLSRNRRALLLVPLLREGECLGAISVSRTEPYRFVEKQLAVLKTFADQAVIAIENTRLFNETKEALERQTATAEILRVISSSPGDLQPVFDAILENALRLCDAHMGVLSLYESRRWQTVAQRGATPEFAEWLTERGAFEPPAFSVLGRMISGARAVSEADLKASRGYRERLLLSQKAVDAGGMRSIAAVPMLKDGAVIGGIVIYRREVRPFAQKQIDLVGTFASQAVIAIENVRLFKELEARTEALMRSVSQLTALGEVGQAISATLDLEKVLNTIAAHALQLTGLDVATIYEFDDATDRFELRAWQNMPEDLIGVFRQMPIRLGEGVVGKAAALREPVQVPDIHDPNYQTRYRDLLIRRGYRAILAVPMLREDRIIGAITVSRSTPGEFPPDVVDLLKTFATQSAMAIQNARLFREIAEKSRQLEEASKHKSQFLASMSHELRTPLNAILGFNEMLLGEVYGPVPEDMQPPIAQMQTSGKHLLRLINNVLDLAKIEAGRMELALSDYSVHDTVESVRATLRPLAEAKGLDFVVDLPPDLPLAYGDPGRITQCLMNLAGNSLKFTKEGRVAIQVDQREGLLVYRVTDTGIGIPADKIGGLFTEFKQTDATIASEFGGTGLGLSISKKFIEMHGGRIWAESEPGAGSTFVFEIPLRAGEGKTP